MTRTSALLIATLTAGVACLGLTPAAAAPASYDPDACVEGYVWRLTSPDDHVCVPQAVQDQAAADNSQEDARRNPEGGPYGPATCVQGYVWREATPEDLVCVVPETRTTTAQENAEAPNRWKATVRKDGSNAHPFLYPAESYAITIVPAGRGAEELSVLVVDAEGAATGSGTGTMVADDQGTQSQRFEFRRSGGGVALSNAFRIVDGSKGSCLTVAEDGKGNGARVVTSPCEGEANQVWSLAGRRDGSWDLRAGRSGKCLTAHNPRLTAPSAGAYLEQWDCLGGKNQAWSLSPTD